MNILQFKLDGVLGEAPTNYEEVSIELKIDPNDTYSTPIVTVNNWDFEGANAIKLITHRNDGLTGGVGIYEGVSLEAILTDDNGSLSICDSYLDLSDANVEWQCGKVFKIPSKLRGKNDWLADVSNNVMFKNLLINGKFTTNDYVQVPYIRSTIPDYNQAAIATLTAYIVIKEMRDAAQKIKEAISQLASVFGALGVLIKVVLIMIWVIIVIIVIVKLILDIFDQLIQPVKYHAAMKWQQLLELGSAEIGLTFKSTIFDDPFYRDTVKMPAKYKSFDDVTNENALGFTVPNTKANGYYQGTFRELLEETKLTFNARIILNDNKELIMERVDKDTSIPTLTLPDLPQETHKTNASEIHSIYRMALKDDLSDENTIDDYEGTTTDVLTMPNTVEHQDMVTLRGRKDINMPFSKAVRKESLSRIEKRFDRLFKEHTKGVNGVLKVANKIIKVRNKIVKKLTKIVKKLKAVGIRVPINTEPIPKIQSVTPQTIEDRLGMMMLSTDFFTVPKVMSIDISSSPRNNKLKTDNSSRWHSEELYDKFHVTQSFVPSAEFPNGNQHLRYAFDEIPFCKEDLVKVINNPRIFDAQGRQGRIENLNYSPYNQTASGEYRVSDKFTKNLRTVKQTSDGF
jgi:hypothetical protein